MILLNFLKIGNDINMSKFKNPSGLYPYQTSKSNFIIIEHDDWISCINPKLISGFNYNKRKMVVTMNNNYIFTITNKDIIKQILNSSG